MNLSKDRIPTKSILAPQSVAAAGTASSGWVDAATALRLVAACGVGAGTGSAAFTWEQGDSSSGGNAKAVTGPGTLTLLTTEHGCTEVKAEQLDLANGFRWVSVKVTVTGGSGTFCAAAVLGAEPRYI